MGEAIAAASLSSAATFKAGGMSNVIYPVPRSCYAVNCRFLLALPRDWWTVSIRDPCLPKLKEHRLVSTRSG